MMSTCRPPDPPRRARRRPRPEPAPSQHSAARSYLASTPRGTVRAPATTTLPRRRNRPRVTRAVVVTLLTKLLGLGLLLGASGLLYDLASSPRLQVSRVSVTGSRLLQPAEVEAAAAVDGLNLFWIRASDVDRRLRQLPPVESTEVALELPDAVLIRVKERQPVAIWQAGEVSFLVDRDGLILAAGATDQPLMVVRDTSGQPLTPGRRVDAAAVRGVGELDGRLRQSFGPQQRQYEYAQETGLNVVQNIGPRLIIGGGDNLDWKMAAIRTIVRYLESSRLSAELIDVRFGDRPYYR